MLYKRISIIKERINHKKKRQKDHEILEGIHRAQKEWLDKEKNK